MSYFDFSRTLVSTVNGATSGFLDCIVVDEVCKNLLHNDNEWTKFPVRTLPGVVQSSIGMMPAPQFVIPITVTSQRALHGHIIA
jgi:hypothetical protein